MADLWHEDLTRHEARIDAARDEEVEIPSCLVGQVEEGSMLGSCDWGNCSREQAGWALGQGAAPDSDPEWLAICHGCAHGDMRDPERHPIQQYISLDQVLAVMDLSEFRG